MKLAATIWLMRLFGLRLKIRRTAKVHWRTGEVLPPGVFVRLPRWLGADAGDKLKAKLMLLSVEQYRSTGKYLPVHIVKIEKKG